MLADKNASKYSVTAVITAHHEGAMAGLAWTSCDAACRHAAKYGVAVETLVLLDRPNQFTRELFDRAVDLADTSVFELDFGDQGKVRNFAASRAKGDFLAFLDADDLWSENWLLDAYLVAKADSNVVVHPEINWFFGDSNNILYILPDDHQFHSIDFLRFGNYWDAMSMMPRPLLQSIQFCDRDIDAGYALEDWYWSCETVAAGVKHRVAPGTIHFKRRRGQSQHMEVVRTKALPRPTEIFSFDHALYRTAK